jgi:ketosteroid isomerase-like protein
MRKPLLTPMIALALLVPAGAAAQQSEERAAVHQVITSLADGIHTNQLGNIDALFAPSGVHVIVDDVALHGWDEYREGHLMPEMARYPELRYAHTGIEASIRGNIAWVAFRWQMSTGGDGPAPVLGRSSAVLEKIDDRWLIAHLHLSR